MATPEQIDEWKRAFGAIYAVDEFIFRALKDKECSYLFSNDWSTAEAEDYAVSVALLDPAELSDNQPAGLVTMIAEEILSVSGLGEPAIAKQIFEKHRDKAQGIYQLMKAFVLSQMPAYTEEDLGELTFNQLASKVALSEQIIQIKQTMFQQVAGGAITFDLVDPEEEEAKAQVEAEKHAANKKPGTAGLNDPIAQRLHQAMGGQ